VTESGGSFQLVLVSLAIQDGVLGAGDRRIQSLPRDAHEVAAHRLHHQPRGPVVRHQSRRRVISETGSGATRVATGVGRLDVIDEQGTSCAQAQPTVIGRFADNLTNPVPQRQQLYSVRGTCAGQRCCPLPSRFE